MQNDCRRVNVLKMHIITDMKETMSVNTMNTENTLFVNMAGCYFTYFEGPV